MLIAVASVCDSPDYVKLDLIALLLVLLTVKQMCVSFQHSEQELFMGVPEMVSFSACL